MKVLYETEEKVLGTREDVKEFLKENLTLAIETIADEELKEFYIAETNYLLEEIDGEYKNEEYIGLTYGPMTGFYVINMNLVKEWKEGEIWNERINSSTNKCLEFNRSNILVQSPSLQKDFFMI